MIQQLTLCFRNLCSHRTPGSRRSWILKTNQKQRKISTKSAVGTPRGWTHCEMTPKRPCSARVSPRPADSQALLLWVFQRLSRQLQARVHCVVVFPSDITSSTFYASRVSIFFSADTRVSCFSLPTRRVCEAFGSPETPVVIFVRARELRSKMSDVEVSHVAGTVSPFAREIAHIHAVVVVGLSFRAERVGASPNERRLWWTRRVICGFFPLTPRVHSALGFLLPSITKLRLCRSRRIGLERPHYFTFHS